MASLQHQPLLLVIRPEPDDLMAAGSGSVLLEQVLRLHAAGLRHLEVAWLDQPGWMGFMQRVQDHCPGLNLGAASVTVSKACLLYTSPSPRDGLLSRMPSSA